MIDNTRAYAAFKAWWKLSPHKDAMVIKKVRRVALAAWMASWTAAMGDPE